MSNSSREFYYKDRDPRIIRQSQVSNKTSAQKNETSEPSQQVSHAQQSTTDLTPDLTTGQNLVTNENTAASLTSIELDMINKVVATIGVSDDVSQKVKKLLVETKSLHICLLNGVRFDVFISAPDFVSINSEESLQILPLQSDLFHDALLVSNPKSSSTSQPLRNAFLVSKQSLEFCSNSIFDSQSNAVAATNTIWPTREETNSRSLFLPNWFPYIPSQNQTTCEEKNGINFLP